MTRQLSTLIFVLIAIASARCLKIHNSKTFLAETSTKAIPTQANVNMLGAAAPFAILAGSTVTNAGATTVTGSIGVNPGSAIAGSPINLIDGELHAADAVGLVAKNAIITTYNNLMNHIGSIDLTGKDLGGLTLAPGVYKFNVTSALTIGTLTLDGQGNPDAQWIFQIGSTLYTGINTAVKMINGGSALNVYWQVGSSATISDKTKMCGNIIAYASITLGDLVELKGRAIAQVGAVTLVANKVSMI